MIADGRARSESVGWPTVRTSPAALNRICLRVCVRFPLCDGILFTTASLPAGFVWPPRT
ncbi:MAG: hypothetical protein BJ554DRAFT_4084 [Olpidium bornovanus]|uniref:Uncharacterized protein n=1 Tax=Olpidium bornovanus TaxID=278681 RepID=A0A8H7ZNH8_9FUNG|nr:MAG: hypothetical protein BJ554DRAFT_4084 [Olpidium bornovanus]